MVKHVTWKSVRNGTSQIDLLFSEMPREMYNQTEESTMKFAHLGTKIMINDHVPSNGETRNCCEDFNHPPIYLLKW